MLNTNPLYRTTIKTILFDIITTLLLYSFAGCKFTETEASIENIEDEERVDTEKSSGKDRQVTDIEKEASKEEATEDTEASEEEIDQEEKDEGEVKEAPTIKLEVYEGPLYSPDDNICYYRIKAVVTGTPEPGIEFSRDDSNGVWGKDKAQVNLVDPSDAYTLKATATNTEGSAVYSIDLSWGCDELKVGKEQEPAYSDKELEYFFETALGVEFGNSQPVLHKWKDNIRIRVNGTPTVADLEALNQVVSELNSLIGSISLSVVDSNPNIELYFAPPDKFSEILPSYVPGNMGFFWLWWYSDGTIYKSTILIASEGITQQERSHLIREELTQNIGIMKDSNRYSDSIFFQDWTDTTQYSPIDRAVISLLYDSRLKPGMNKDKLKEILAAP